MAASELHWAEVGPHRIAYREVGRGAPLVFLHGFLCDSRCWRPQLAALSDHYRVIAWDAPGAGASSDPPDAFTMDEWADVLAAFFDALAIPRTHLAGLSWGGVLAQVFCARHSRRVDRLILADTYAGWKGSLSPAACEQRLARCEHDSDLPSAEFARRWVPEMFTPAAPAALIEELTTVFHDFHPHGFRLMAKSLADTDTTDVLGAISAPTLVLWGDDDRRSPIQVGAQLRDAISGAELAVIAQAGHISNMEQPAAFSAHVRHFLTAQSPAGS